MNLRFHTPHQYVFFHNHIQHLLLLWEKERRKEIYIIREESEKELLLQYPGETYIEMVLQEVEPVFFQTLETETEQFSALLGATFLFNQRLIGMYYHQYRPEEEPLYFFEIINEQLKEIPDEEYEAVVTAFMKYFPQYASTQSE